MAGPFRSWQSHFDHGTGMSWLTTIYHHGLLIIGLTLALAESNLLVSAGLRVGLADCNIGPPITNN